MVCGVLGGIWSFWGERSGCPPSSALAAGGVGPPRVPLVRLRRRRCWRRWRLLWVVLELRGRRTEGDGASIPVLLQLPSLVGALGPAFFVGFVSRDLDHYLGSVDRELPGLGKQPIDRRRHPGEGRNVLVRGRQRPDGRVAAAWTNADGAPLAANGGGYSRISPLYRTSSSSVRPSRSLSRGGTVGFKQQILKKLMKMYNMVQFSCRDFHVLQNQIRATRVIIV